MQVLGIKGAKTVSVPSSSEWDETQLVSLLGSKEKPAPQIDIGIYIEASQEPEKHKYVSENTKK